MRIMRMKRLLTVLAVLFTISGTYMFSGGNSAGASTNGGTKSESADAHMVSVVAITEVFADGLKVSAVAVKYDKNISDESLSPSDYIVKTEVAGQKITKVYTSADGEKTSQRGQNGPYVILELSTDYVIPVSAGTSSKSANQGTGSGTPGQRSGTPGQGSGTPDQGSGGPGQSPGGSGAMPSTTAKENLILNSEVVTQVGNISWNPSAHPATLKSSAHGGDGKTVSVTQVGNITATDGMTITAGSSEKDNEYCRNLIVDGFLKPDYRGADGMGGKYNIYFPRDYDTAKKYPVVVFITSSAPGHGTHAGVLIQGLGGVIWAEKDEQARHKAIVIVPAFGDALVDENLEPTKREGPGGSQGRAEYQYETVLATIDYLMENIPNIDKDRVYLTGQGDGARAAMKMMTDQPDMYAAALLFSPDFDKARISKLSKADMWIVVSEGDDAIYSNMEGCIEGLKAAGARISKAVWNGRASAAQFVSNAGGMIAEGSNIKYTVLKKGTVVPSGVSDDSINNHAYTWRIGYSIKDLRDWLFTQKR